MGRGRSSSLANRGGAHAHEKLNVGASRKVGDNHYWLARRFGESGLGPKPGPITESPVTLRPRPPGAERIRRLLTLSHVVGEELNGGNGHPFCAEPDHHCHPVARVSPTNGNGGRGEAGMRRPRPLGKGEALCKPSHGSRGSTCGGCFATATGGARRGVVRFVSARA